ncbi:MAG: hypothetical protein JO356_05965 [Acidobacteria bacterium]|nr:hypothetical protein [Acidobacteriota bacterium]
MKVNSNAKPLRQHFGSWRTVDVTSDAVSEYIENLRDEGYTAATCNRHTQLLGKAYKLAIRTKKLSAAPFIPRLSESLRWSDVTDDVPACQELKKLQA